MKYNVLDLFCGAGGMSYGFGMNDVFNIINGIDVWDIAIKTYNKNFSHDGICKDLTTYPPEEYDREYSPTSIDIIIGGPSCQGMSYAGKRDPSDKRNKLFLQYVKYLDYFKPKIFIMENVMGILTMKDDDGTLILKKIMDCFDENYNCRYFKLMASDFEVPQNRRRVIFVGVRKDLNIIPSEPHIECKERIPIKSVLLPREVIDKKYFLSQRAIDGINAKKERMRQRNCGFGAQFCNPDKPSYTIPARYWKDGYDCLIKYDENCIRRLTETELALIQTFPPSFKFVGSTKDMIIQIGNAVPCMLAYHLGKYVKEILQTC